MIKIWTSDYVQITYWTTVSIIRDFPGGPGVKTLPSKAEGMGSIPGRGVKIPHASWPKNWNIKQKQYFKDFKKGPHQKRKKKK